MHVNIHIWHSFTHIYLKRQIWLFFQSHSCWCVPILPDVVSPIAATVKVSPMTITVTNSSTQRHLCPLNFIQQVTSGGTKKKKKTLTTSFCQAPLYGGLPRTILSKQIFMGKVQNFHGQTQIFNGQKPFSAHVSLSKYVTLWQTYFHGQSATFSWTNK